MKIVGFHMHPYLKDSENMRFYPDGAKEKIFHENAERRLGL